MLGEKVEQASDKNILLTCPPPLMSLTNMFSTYQQLSIWHIKFKKLNKNNTQIKQKTIQILQVLKVLIKRRRLKKIKNQKSIKRIKTNIKNKENQRKRENEDIREVDLLLHKETRIYPQTVAVFKILNRFIKL